MMLLSEILSDLEEYRRDPHFSSIYVLEILSTPSDFVT
jgi:hypothetical protein